MNSAKEIFYERQASTIIKKLNARRMEGYYCATVEEAKKKMLELIKAETTEKKTISYGGSMTLDENGFKDTILNAGHQLIIRENYKTPEEQKQLKALQITSDVFLTSTNAITLDGELVNIDGRGNRVSFSIYGPDSVIVIAGMNKVVADVDEAMKRIKTCAVPPNCVRLDCKTPCAITGKCGECYTDTICCQTVITRASRIENRIKVILVGQELGY